MNHVNHQQYQQSSNTNKKHTENLARTGIEYPMMRDLGHEPFVTTQKEFEKLLNQYNGKPDKQGNQLYNFDSIAVVNAGQRDPDQGGVAGASASKARELANKGQEHEFSKIIMGGDTGKKLYDIIKVLERNY